MLRLPILTLRLLRVGMVVIGPTTPLHLRPLLKDLRVTIATVLYMALHHPVAKVLPQHQPLLLPAPGTANVLNGREVNVSMRG